MRWWRELFPILPHVPRPKLSAVRDVSTLGPWQMLIVGLDAPGFDRGVGSTAIYYTPHSNVSFMFTLCLQWFVFSWCVSIPVYHSCAHSTGHENRENMKNRAPWGECTEHEELEPARSTSCGFLPDEACCDAPKSSLLLAPAVTNCVRFLPKSFRNLVPRIPCIRDVWNDRTVGSRLIDATASVHCSIHVAWPEEWAHAHFSIQTMAPGVHVSSPLLCAERTVALG